MHGFLAAKQEPNGCIMWINYGLPPQMPNGMSGIDLAMNLRALKQDLPVLYVTAHSPSALAPETLNAPNTRLLAKPFSPPN